MRIAATGSDELWLNGRLATMDPAVGEPYGCLEGHAMVVRGERIAAIAPLSQIDAASFGGRVHDVGGQWITPGLIDCHTHLVHAGNRAVEWSARLAGASYVDIAKAGGGILNSVRATRAASVDELVESAWPRMQALAAEGVCCVEIKSGYGLTLVDERKMLEVARLLGDRAEMEIAPTLLAAHAVPPEFSGQSDAYVDLIVHEMIPLLAAEGLAEAVDVFCESIAFAPTQAERIWRAAIDCGLAIKGHVEQLSKLGGAQLLAALGALSADHLEYLDAAGARALGASRTVAVLLPTAYYFLREKQKPPIAALRAAGARMAVGTDLNPGTAPIASLRLALNMACVVFELTPEEALAGATVHAAAALGRADRMGTLTPGKLANFLVWDVEHLAEIIFRLGVNPLTARVVRGNIALVDPLEKVRVSTPANIVGERVWQGRSDVGEGPRALRWHERIQPLEDGTQAPGIALLGFSCDEGVRRNGGRIGAAAGPNVIRRALANLAWHGKSPVYDAGNVDCSDGALEEAQENLGKAVERLCRAGHLPVVLGGGHETAVGTFAGVMDAAVDLTIGIVNIDAHFDLRPAPPATSGTPFSQIAERLASAGKPFQYLCLGVAEHSNTAALLDRALQLGVHWKTDREVASADSADAIKAIAQFASKVDGIYLSIDLDVLPAGTMPAVSSPAGRGVSLEIVEKIIHFLGTTGKLLAADVVELNPQFDVAGNGAKVAAYLVWSLAGSKWRHGLPLN